MSERNNDNTKKYYKDNDDRRQRSSDFPRNEYKHRRRLSRSNSRDRENESHGSNRDSKYRHEKRRRDSSSNRSPKRDYYDRRSEITRRSSSQSPNRYNRGRDSIEGHQRDIPSDQQEFDDKAEPPKEKVNFGLSGILAKETNNYNGVLVKYNEPPDAIKPTEKYRWYVYKDDKEIDMLQLYRHSAYLIGRDRKVADIPVDHASISKQHAVLQYRKVEEVDPKTNKSYKAIKPYIIDLDTTNGTFVNGNEIPKSCFFELKSQDIIKFACSTREYVFIKEEK